MENKEISEQLTNIEDFLKKEFGKMQKKVTALEEEIEWIQTRLDFFEENGIKTRDDMK
ncbi:hypothetical protein [Oceanobacillus oncorhynchi]|uniref:hypothetical protein n=1 Tax=Oceanobacillus oncorhynchi TaxID=545501 RepID=UPI0034D6DC3E